MGLLSPVLRGALRREVPLERYLAQREAGFWLRFPRPDTSFQETVGPTPADEAGEAIGLTLDQRMWLGQTRDQYLAGQPELWTNPAPTFDLAGGGSSPSYNQSTRTLSNSVSSSVSGYPRARFGLGLTAGRVYRISGRIDGDRAGINVIRPANGGSASNVPYNTSTGVFDGFVVAQETYVEFVTAISSTYSLVIAEISVREVSQVSATQATAGSRPTWQPGGAEFDGTADNLLTNYTVGSGSNTLIARVTVPASLAATSFIAGATAADTSARSMLGIDTAGRLVGGVGLSFVTDAVDLRGQTAVVGVSHDSATVQLFRLNSLGVSAAKTGDQTTVVPYRVGARNVGGTAAGFWPGSMSDAIAWRGGPILDESTFRRIAEQLNRLNAA